MPALKGEAARRQGPEKRPLRIVGNAGTLDLSEHRASGVEEDLSAFLVPFLSDGQVMLDAARPVLA
jgi:hypothetical protein